MGNSRGYALKPCFDCHIEHRRLYRSRGRYVCWKCHFKYVHIIGDYTSRNSISLKTALDKTYTIKGYSNGAKYMQGRLNLPRCLIGKKVKLVLISYKTKDL